MAKNYTTEERGIIDQAVSNAAEGFDFFAGTVNGPVRGQSIYIDPGNGNDNPAISGHAVGSGNTTVPGECDFITSVAIPGVSPLLPVTLTSTIRVNLTAGYQTDMQYTFASDGQLTTYCTFDLFTTQVYANTTLSVAIINTTIATVHVASVAGLPVNGGFVMTVQSEQLFVTDVFAGNTTLAVIRGYNGTTKATHSNGTAISASLWTGRLQVQDDLSSPKDFNLGNYSSDIDHTIRAIVARDVVECYVDGALLGTWQYSRTIDSITPFRLYFNQNDTNPTPGQTSFSLLTIKN